MPDKDGIEELNFQLSIFCYPWNPFHAQLRKESTRPGRSSCLLPEKHLKPCCDVAPYTWPVRTVQWEGRGLMPSLYPIFIDNGRNPWTQAAGVHGMDREAASWMRHPAGTFRLITGSVNILKFPDPAISRGMMGKFRFRKTDHENARQPVRTSPNSRSKCRQTAERLCQMAENALNHAVRSLECA